MLTNIPLEFRKFLRHCDTLKRILKDTQCALEDIKNNLVLGEIQEHLCTNSFESLRYTLEQSPALVIFGQNCHAKALFVNTVLSQNILPLNSHRWRWVKFFYGYQKTLRLTLGHDFEIVENLKAHEEPWETVPEEDLQRNENESPLDHCPTVEIELCHSVLRDNVILMVPPDCSSDQLNDVLLKQLDQFLPLLVYVTCEDILNYSNIQEIRILKEKYSDLPILFVNMLANDIKVSFYCDSEQEHLGYAGKRLANLSNQLVRLGYLSDSFNSDTDGLPTRKPFCADCSIHNNLITDSNLSEQFLYFIQEVLKSNLLKMSALLSEVHNVCLRIFILSAFDMAREIQITPRRIGYAQDIEMKLYKSLMKIAGEKQDEITKIIQATLHNMRINVAEVLDGYQYRGVVYFTIVADKKINDSSWLPEWHCVLDRPFAGVSSTISGDILSESLAKDDSSSYPKSAKVATMEIHQLVLRRLSNSVATQLVQSVGCLQESFTGTLQRCLESLERNCHELEGNLLASTAVKQIVSAAYNIDLKSSTSFSVVHSFMDRLRKFVHTFSWTTCTQPQFDLQWQTQVVTDMIDNLSSSKLAKTISTQFQEHVRSSHEAFHSAMRFIENQLSGQLEQTEEQRIAIRKRHAPRFARLTLESTSLCDLVRFGMPKPIREIGRGQYGVVFACEPWGGVNPCAIKSVVPPDERHWNDLAMEFYYTRIIPEHPRIVKLRGSVVDHSYGGGCSSAVLLVMERMTRDLYWGLRSGMPWTKRVQIAIDVVEGIRYLHSQGLVHRDIKLKNVLLDEEDRAKLTDFGFCIPEAMMSGSVVGTPVHMAPELLSGRYDSSVDVYAFGILFWYICAGQVQLPIHFEQFHSKEQLWNSVKKGMRPECLPHFDQACWNLMEQCWAAEPSERPLLGYVQPQLEIIQREAIAEAASGKFRL